MTSPVGTPVGRTVPLIVPPASIRRSSHGSNPSRRASPGGAAPLAARRGEFVGRCEQERQPVKSLTDHVQNLPGSRIWMRSDAAARSFSPNRLEGGAHRHRAQCWSRNTNALLPTRRAVEGGRTGIVVRLRPAEIAASPAAG